MEDSQSVPNPLFQCNYFYASRELLPMTATTAGGGGGGDETRRDAARRDGDIACVRPAAERRHWFHRGETRDAAGGTWVGPGRPCTPARASCSTLADGGRGKRVGWEKVGKPARDRRGWDKDRCHWQHLGELETDRRKLTRD